MKARAAYWRTSRLFQGAPKLARCCVVWIVLLFLQRAVLGNLGLKARQDPLFSQFVDQSVR